MRLNINPTSTTGLGVGMQLALLLLLVPTQVTSRAVRYDLVSMPKDGIVASSGPTRNILTPQTGSQSQPFPGSQQVEKRDPNKDKKKKKQSNPPAANKITTPPAAKNKANPPPATQKKTESKQQPLTDKKKNAVPVAGSSTGGKGGTTNPISRRGKIDHFCSTTTSGKTVGGTRANTPVAGKPAPVQAQVVKKPKTQKVLKRAPGAMLFKRDECSLWDCGVDIFGTNPGEEKDDTGPEDALPKEDAADINLTIFHKDTQELLDEEEVEVDDDGKGGDLNLELDKLNLDEKNKGKGTKSGSGSTTPNSKASTTSTLDLSSAFELLYAIEDDTPAPGGSTGASKKKVPKYKRENVWKCVDENGQIDLKYASLYYPTPRKIKTEDSAGTLYHWYGDQARVIAPGNCYKDDFVGYKTPAVGVNLGWGLVRVPPKERENYKLEKFHTEHIYELGMLANFLTYAVEEEKKKGVKNVCGLFQRYLFSRHRTLKDAELVKKRIESRQEYILPIYRLVNQMGSSIEPQRLAVLDKDVNMLKHRVLLGKTIMAEATWQAKTLQQKITAFRRLGEVMVYMDKTRPQFIETITAMNKELNSIDKAFKEIRKQLKGVKIEAFIKGDLATYHKNWINGRIDHANADVKEVMKDWLNSIHNDGKFKGLTSAELKKAWGTDVPKLKTRFPAIATI